MYKILLTTHGNMCTGMLDTIKLIIPSVENVTVIPFYTEEPGSEPEKELDAWLAGIGEEDVALVATDILWGSVNQKIHLKASGRSNIHVVTGVNLPLMLELIALDEDSFRENENVVSDTVTESRDYIVYMREYKIESNDMDE